MSGLDDPFTVLCVDDDPALGDAIERRLLQVPGFAGLHRVEQPATVVETILDTAPSIVLLDLDLSGNVAPLELVAEIVRARPSARVILLAVHPTVELASQSMSRGAWGFVSKGTTAARLIDALLRVRRGEAVIELDDD
jgi:two-component system uhpT operon response regulator UhpA